MSFGDLNLPSERDPDPRPAKKPRYVAKKSCTECVQAHLSCDRVRPLCCNCRRKHKTCIYHDPPSAVEPFSFSSALGDFDPNAPTRAYQMNELATMPLPAIQSIFIHQSQLISQQQSLMEHLKSLLAKQSERTVNSNSNSEAMTSSSTSPSLLYTAPTSHYTWDPNETDLHYLQCQATLMWDRHPDRETAEKHIFMLLKDFIDAHPARPALIIKFNELNSTFIAASPALLEFTGMTTSFAQDCISKRINPSSSESRVTSLNQILGVYLTNIKAGHTFLYEKSSEVYQKGNRITASFFTTLLYDPNDQLYALLGCFTPHPTPQPIVKPVILNLHCYTCSKPLTPSFQLCSLPQADLSSSLLHQQSNSPGSFSSPQEFLSPITPIPTFSRDDSSPQTSLSNPSRQQQQTSDFFAFDQEFPPSLCHLFLGNE